MKGGNLLFHKTQLDGAYVIELEKRGDERGFFARLFCCNEFRNAGLQSAFVQVNNSLSTQQGTLRGMHYQLPPRRNQARSLYSRIHVGLHR